MKKKNIQNHYSRFSIRWKLIVYFAVFVAISILVMWGFQVYLLSNVYEFSRRREMARSAQEISKYIGHEELAMQAYDYALDGIMSVIIYRVGENGNFKSIIDIDPTDQPDTNFELEQAILGACYQKALDHNGVYTGNFTVSGVEISRRDLQVIRLGASASSHKNSLANIRLIHLQIAKDAEGQEHLIFLNASLQPLNSVVMILRVVFVAVFSVLLVLASIMVWLLYRRITAPLININNSARLLARGKYDVEFSGEGYREAHELADTLKSL